MPTVNLPAIADTYINAASSSTNYGGGSDMVIAGPASTQHALIKFDLSSIPPDAVISSAILTLECMGVEGDNDARSAPMHRSLVEWFEGTSAPSGDRSTWNHRNANGSVAWGTAGGQSGTDYEATPTDTESITVVGPYSWDVGTDVQNFVNGTHTNHGWWILGLSGQDGFWKHFATHEHALSEWHPELEITYSTESVIGSAAGQATVTGTLDAVGFLAGSIAGEASTSGTLIDSSLQGSSTGSSTVSGDLSGYGILDGIIAGTAAAEADGLSALLAEGSSTGQASATATGALSAILRGEISGLATTIATGWAKAVNVATYQPKVPAPILRITDGVRFFDLLRPEFYTLCEWNPAISQYKEGGYWSDSPQSAGRRLRSKNFSNVVEVMEFSGKGKSQDQLIRTTQELLQWLESAADFWTSTWASRPVYLEARSAYETNTRYAILHMGSIPELRNPYGQPFFTSGSQASFDKITLRLERGHWLDQPPGKSSCVPISSIRDWTVTGWASSDTGGSSFGGDAVSGDVLSIIQASNGDIVIGTNAAATVYRSQDEGLTWENLSSIGTSTDSLNALAQDQSGNLYAAVTGAAAAQGIWKSTDFGSSWSRVKTDPSGNGYNDITFIRGNNTLVAVADAATFPNSNVALSWDQGGVWVEPSFSHYYYDVKSVAAGDYPFLANVTPGVSPVGPEAFFGTDSFYTLGGRAGRSGGGFVQVTASGAMGNGGLDMTAYNYRNTQGDTLVRALWAVRSHLNTGNTEIWQWPHPGTGENKFGIISTITGKNFNVLYTDPTPDWTNAQRTIWAGENGEIWVSYNSGYTWALATTAPTNEVRCFLRTAAGTLIAGCENAEIFLFAGGSGSEGGGSEEIPTESGNSYIINSQPLGREATCADEVFAANKSSFTNITHILLHDGSSYTELQFATDPPYSLLSSPPTVNDTLYFGVMTSDANIASGPFSSIIFDLTQEAEDITVVWEYWNGSSWATLAVQDRTEGFLVPGVHGVHWSVPSDWATTSVNSVTGYWVRATVDSVGASPLEPIHGNRFIYTLNLPYVEVGEDVIGGDIPARSQILWANRSDNPNGSPSFEAHRLLVGLRSYDRGSGFNAYLNLSDVHIPFGITMVTFEGGFQDDVAAPTNRSYQVAYGSSGDLNAWKDLVCVSMDAAAARDYQGEFRAFLRCYVAGGDADDWRFRLSVGFGSGSVISFSKDRYAKPVSTSFRMLDLGSVRIPSTNLATGELYQGGCDVLNLTVQGYATATGITAKLYDLILIPLDEWAGDFLHTNLNASVSSEINGNNYLDIDSVSNPKKSLTAYNRLRSGLIKVVYQPIANGEAILQRGRRQRLWFLAATYDFSGNSWGAYPSASGSVRVNKVQQYLGLRGSR